ncbi:MAG TPA: DUF1684 domain-containing protein [Bacteroidota bacterium]
MNASAARKKNRSRAGAAALPLLLVAPWLGLALWSCTSRPVPPAAAPADSAFVVRDNLTHRAEVDSFFRFEDGSPFRRDTTIRYHGLRWFPIDVRYRVTAVLHRYDRPEPVTVMGTKGEERHQLKYGYFAFALPGEKGTPVPLQINAYKFTPSDSMRYRLYRNNLSVWFRDRTTGKETYDVGRYVEVGDEDPDPAHVYVLDFNKAYNPYCAYSALYSCAVPRKEDYLDIALRAGEMKYHD